MTLKTRFAPSPTGYLHIGGARTALFSWLYARKHGGSFVLRVEDTDQERSTQESVNAILEGMTWLGLEYDEGPFYQTQRFDRYREVIQQLLDEGKAYKCYCSKERLDALREEQQKRKEKPRYDGKCRDLQEPPAPDAPYVIRFRNPQEGAVVVDDRVHGRVAFNNSELDDLIIARTDGSPTYNLTVVVDDMDMGITHVIRGDDHLNNTPRQVNILQALGVEPPVYAHVPMILGEDGKRLSKRHGAVGVMNYRDQGYMPEAVLNYLVRLGWSHGDQEVFSLDEMVQLFDIDSLNAKASALNVSKLDWLNQHYMKTLDPAHVARHLSWHMGQLGIDPSDGPSLEAVVVSQRERAKTLDEMARNSAFFYRMPEAYDEKAARKNLKAETRPALAALREALAAVSEWERGTLHETVQYVAERLELKLGKVAQPLRVALSGGPVSPPIDETLELLGRDVSLARIDAALAFIDAGESV
ncbi:glutamate--tRNA ligase [Aquisalimonas asiatica]|uniref:Glutamate--tRNA ligase n=1 Tax=Aquisalimonas asiatica TaxID=406100 RepID=A0A1H8UJG4_9GAMM|nr:glutamate--tRNA ligase [Aquisalimonas asiatica]SEP03014.1 glutamyl-tRNA synthetase [Aquisalimonas asiatica]